MCACVRVCVCVCVDVLVFSLPSKGHLCDLCLSDLKRACGHPHYEAKPDFELANVGLNVVRTRLAKTTGGHDLGCVPGSFQGSAFQSWPLSRNQRDPNGFRGFWLPQEKLTGPQRPPSKQPTQTQRHRPPARPLGALQAPAQC